VDLCSGLDEVLQVRPREEVPQVREFAVGRVLDVHNAPAVFAPSDRFAVDDDGGLGADDRKGNDVLFRAQASAAELQ
jgi:hypothetical protein